VKFRQLNLIVRTEKVKRNQPIK